MKLERFQHAVRSWFFPIVRFVDRITWLVLFAMMIMTITDVLLRKIVNKSILGSLELTEMMMAIVIFGALAYCELNDGHIRVDLVMKRFSRRVQLMFDALGQFICFILFGFMTWALLDHASSMREWGEVTLDLLLPVYPIVYVSAFCCALLALVLLYKSLAALSEVSKS